jgi:tetratricopeptide (TPR) repeat protein
VTAQLIDTQSGTHIWTGRYNRPEGDLFAIQDEVVSHVVAAVAGFGGAIIRAELKLAKRRHPASLQAYELYLLGYEQEARVDREGTLKAIDLEEAALRADPEFSRAWTVLGWALGTAAANDWIADVAAARARQSEAVRKAAELDPGDGIAMLELGALRGREGDIAGATVALERALIVGANHADTLVLLSRPVAGILGREEGALSLIGRAFALNPNTPKWYAGYHARAAYFAQQFEAALEASRRAPYTQASRLFQLLALAQLGRTDEVEAAAHAFRADFPNFRGSEFAARVPLVAQRVRSLFLDGLLKANLNAD